MRFESLPRIRSRGEIVYGTEWARNFHVTDNHELMHVLSGKMRLTLPGDRIFPAGPGDTLLLRAGTRHKDCFEFREGLKILLLHFDWTGDEEFWENFDNARALRLNSATRYQVSWLLEQIRDDRRTDEFSLQLNNSFLLTTLLLFRRALNAGTTVPAAGKRDFVVEAKNYLKRNFGSPFRLEDLARHLQISPCHLSRQFRKRSDFRLAAYLTELRLNEAKRLLHDSRMQIAEVAETVGFGSANYFAKVFRRHVGVPPSEYR